MRFLVFLLVLTMAAQPLQAGGCAMDSEHSQQNSHTSSHEGMTMPDSHDCCDGDNSNPNESCDGGMNCGPCFFSAMVLPRLAPVLPANLHAKVPPYQTGMVPPSHASPPFRPPIA